MNHVMHSLNRGLIHIFINGNAVLNARITFSLHEIKENFKLYQIWKETVKTLASVLKTNLWKNCTTYW